MIRFILKQLVNLCLLLVLLPAQASAQRDLTHYVNPFIGTAGHGHTFPGAIVPFGMVQLSPDTRLTGWDGCSGYHYSDSKIYGFSHTHLSGTGISDYGDILLTPTVGRNYSGRFQHQNETATPGYYSVKLEDEDILVELTATARAGMHRYSFPRTEDANIIVDLAHRDKVLDSGLRITSQTTVAGWRRSQAWAKDQIVYFALEFSQPFTAHRSTDNDLKTYFRFDTRAGAPVLVKIGISAVDMDGARRNLNAELNHWNFEKVKADATAAWNAELNKITVSGGTISQLTNFYTSLYHVMTAPNLFMDVDGRYRGRDFKTHTAEGFTNYTVFSLWDTFRAAHPLYTIIDRKRTRDFINTFLAQYEQGGRLPVWELAANETDTMIGYHAVSVIADAAAKGIDGFDLNKAFQAMKHSAELREHRGLGAYISHGFISTEEERESVSKVLEYAYDDWCIAEVARMLGKKADYDRYNARAQSYKNVFDRATGFMRPRSNANWVEPFDPREVTFAFTEANSWQYTFFAPHDVSGLIALMGRKQFARKLDQLFTADSRTTGREQADITGLIGQYAHGNEPSHHMAYLYDYVGQPWKTQSRVRQIMDQFYKPEPDGLIGNEDCGQMSAWYVLSAAGFYPVTPGSTVYAIGSPLFAEARFNLENGKSFVVRTVNGSKRNVYIQSATLNGKAYNKSFLVHADLMAGGELVFVMGPRLNVRWGTGMRNEPFSRIAGAEIVPVPVIKAAGQTFRGRLQIDLASLDSESVNIYYTTDGSAPSAKSRKFTRPFFIEADTTVKALAIAAGGRRSQVATAKYHRIPHNWNITMESRYSSQYTGGGDFAVIDGIRGTTNWSGGGWQGYWGKDFVAVLDLGKVEDVSRVGAGFLQDIGSWIWMPTRVEFELSMDGRTFGPAILIANDVSDRQEGVVTRDFVRSIPPKKARYVRIRAVNFGKIPSWHPGSGGDAWIFVDEIVIR
ncbi:MAG TPA: GH92 family glycosyl hydrolase [Pyrinomonadaceae bacterium]|nr:GH92 family glycosyl hydrolase [Pyrinomonadaceae bacterium]